MIFNQEYLESKINSILKRQKISYDGFFSETEECDKADGNAGWITVLYISILNDYNYSDYKDVKNRKALQTYMTLAIDSINIYNPIAINIIGADVYAIYETPLPEDDWNIYLRSSELFSILRATNRIFGTEMEFGIGIATGEQMLSKISGKKNGGYSFWMGDAIQNARDLSSRGGINITLDVLNNIENRMRKEFGEDYYDIADEYFLEEYFANYTLGYKVLVNSDTTSQLDHIDLIVDFNESDKSEIILKSDHQGLIDSLIKNTQDRSIEWRDANGKDLFKGDSYYHLFFTKKNGKDYQFQVDVNNKNSQKLLKLEVRTNHVLVLTLENENELNFLYQTILYSNKEFDWENEFNNRRVLGYKDFLVVHDTFSCTYKNHSISEITAFVNVVTKAGIKKLVKLMAGYCQNCNAYFILNKDYQTLKNQGSILCQISDQTKVSVRKNGNDFFSTLSDESKLKILGYNVGEKEGLTDRQRRVILETIVDEGMMTTSQICSHLDWLYESRMNMEHQQNAIYKWKMDREHIQGYRRNEYRHIGISKLTYR